MTSQAQLTHVANVEDDSTDEAFEVFKYNDRIPQRGHRRKHADWFLTTAADLTRGLPTGRAADYQRRT